MRPSASSRASASSSTPGSAFPLGSTLLPDGTNFAVASDVAAGMLLCLFDADGTENRHRLQESTHQVWHARLPGVGPGQRYGFRVDGPYDRIHYRKRLV